MSSTSRATARYGAFFLVLATGAQVGVSLLQQGLAVLSYALGESIHLTLAQTGTLVSATSLGMIVAMLLSGPVIDQRGVRPILTFSALSAFAASVLLVNQRSYPGLLLALALIGFTLGATPVAGARAIFERFAGQRRGLAMGIRQTGVPLGAAIAAAALPLWALRMGAFSPWVPLAGLALVLNLALALASPAKRRIATKPKAAPLLQDLRRLLRPSLISFLLGAGQYGLLTYTVASAPPGPERAIAGGLLAAAQIGGALGRVVFGHVSDRIRSRPEVVGFAALLGAVGIALSTHLHAPIWLMTVSYLVTGAGAIGWNALMLTWAGERVSSERSASAIAIGSTSVYAGSVVFPPLFGLVASHSGFSVAWYGLSGLLCVAALIALSAGTARGSPQR